MTPTNRLAAISDSSRRRLLALLSAAAVFLSGFGVLALLWSLGSWEKHLPGLFDYRAATLGDAILLPTITAILVGCLGTPQLRRASNERRWLLTSLILGGVLGAATQLLWLADDDPALNWTLPAAHRFNLPGWYHSGFLTAVSGVLLGLSTTAARRVHETGKHSPELVRHWATGSWLSVLLGAAVGFAGLVSLDNQSSSSGLASTSTLAALLLAGALAIAALTWAFRRHLLPAIPRLSLGLGIAGLLCLAST